VPRLLRLVVGLVLTTTALAAATSCGHGCTATKLSVTPLTIANPDTPVRLQATLTSGGQPVAGAPVSFYSSTVGGNHGLNSNTGGSRFGSAKTDADGVATQVFPDGISDFALQPGENLVGYSASFGELNTIRGTDYCFAKSGQAAITIDG
jgi:hypothetical protein